MIDVQPLIAGGVDVAGVATEEFLNRFSAAHHRQGHEMYAGTYPIPEFNPRLDVSYQVAKPIAFDLTPLGEDGFRRLWLAHLRFKGAPSLLESDIVMVPPNLRVVSQGVKFTFIVHKASSDEVDYQVSFKWDLEARCAVLLVDAENGQKAIRLEPVKVTFSKPARDILAEIKKGFRDELKRRQPGTCSADVLGMREDDPVWCMNLERLVLFIINQILAMQMSNFIRSWNLPRVFELIKGVGLAPTYLAIGSNAIIVGGKVSQIGLSASPVAGQISAFLEEYHERVNEEFQGMTKEELVKWRPESSPSLKWLQAKEAELKKKTDGRSKKVRERAKAYPESIQILSNDDLFNTIAKSYLHLHEHGEDEKKWVAVGARYHWWLNITNGRANVIPQGIHAAAHLELGATVGVGCLDPDPKHWGEWTWLDLGATLTPKPEFGLNAEFDFSRTGVYIAGRSTVESIGVDIHGIPGWASDVIGWLTEQLSRPLVHVIGLFIASMHVKIVDYPTTFPGTTLVVGENNWRVNTRLGNSGPYLVLTADTKFA